MQLSDDSILNFITRFDDEFDGLLSRRHAYSRVVSLAHFHSLITDLNLSSQDHVGVISGSSEELELHFLKPKKLSIISFELDKRYDLDLDWSKNSIKENFSFTICNQVLEHVFNPQMAFKNLCHMTAPNGYLYVSIPTINCIHGEPYFYSSGFHPRFLERLSREYGLETISIGYWGSQKYMLNAVDGKWLFERLLRPGFHRKGDLKFPFQIFKDGRLKDTGKNQVITDCWGLFKKPPIQK